MSITPFSGITNDAAATPAYMNAKFAEVYSNLDGLFASSATTSGVVSSARSIIYVHDIAGTDWSTRVQAAINMLPAAGGVVDATGISGNQVMSQHVSLNTRNKLLIGYNTIVMLDYMIRIPATNHGCTIEGPTPFGGDGPTPDANRTRLLPTGNSVSAISVGDAGGDTVNTNIRNVSVTASYSTTSYVGIRMANCITWVIDQCRLAQNSASTRSQVGIELNGLGGYTGHGQIINPWVQCGQFGIWFTGSGAAAANANRIIGGTLSGTSLGAGIYIDGASSNGNTIVGTDLENWGSALSMAYGGNSAWGLRLESNWTNIHLGSGVKAAFIQATASGSTHSSINLGVNNQIYIGHSGSNNYLSSIQATQLSVRTAAASALTVSAANTLLHADEVIFTIGGASGASMAIHSGGTVYVFNSALSAKAT